MKYLKRLYCIVTKNPYFLCLNWLLLKLDCAAVNATIFCICIHVYVCERACDHVCVLVRRCRFGRFASNELKWETVGTVTQSQTIILYIVYTPIVSLFLFVYAIRDCAYTAPIYSIYIYSKQVFKGTWKRINDWVYFEQGILLYSRRSLLHALKYNFDFKF